MAVDLAIDIRNSRIRGAFFKEGTLIENFIFPMNWLSKNTFQDFLKNKTVSHVLSCSSALEADQILQSVFSENQVLFHLLSIKDYPTLLDIEEPNAAKAHCIAHIYGALFHFPCNDCIIVDISADVAFDYVTKKGQYIGGAFFPGTATPRSIEKPTSSLAKTTNASIQYGIYYGLLGAVERITDELRMTSASPSSVKVIATGDAIPTEENHLFLNDLQELADLIDPNLVLIGLYEILKERIHKKGESSYGIHT